MNKKKKNKDVIDTNESSDTTDTKVEAEAERTEDIQEISLEQQMDDLKQKLQRMGADYQNYQKRSIRQIDEAARMAKENFARSLLPVLDNFEHTLNADHSSQDIEAVLKGVKIVYDHMADILSSQSVEVIKVEPGEPFDPTRHEAMLKQESEEFEENAVIAEFVRGYKMNDRTLRPAKVSVAKAPEPPAAAEDENQEKPEEA
jgi:molecular chaperone GrpE